MIVEKNYVITNDVVCGKIENSAFTFTQLGALKELGLNAFTSEGLGQLITNLTEIKALLDE